VLRVLLGLSAFGLAGTLVCAAGWFLAARGGMSLEDLGPDERQALLESLLHESPGVFAAAWYDPPIGYTLRPQHRVSAWDDDFTANELGYRSGPPTKAPEVFRVVFLGDSWTFGMGVRREESFPHQLATLANARRRNGREIEAWSLALPGYNTFNELAALDFFFERLQPDAVVVCPTMNDVDSSGHVLPNGSLTRIGVVRDGFGNDHSLVYRSQLVDSFQFKQRWLAAFRAVKEIEERLRARRIPLLVYFTATWDPSFAHWLVAESRLAAPYVITPGELTGLRWRNPPPFRHGTPAANRLYAGMVYQGLARLLRWPALEPSAEDVEVPVYSPASAPALAGPARKLLRRASARVPEAYQPSPEAALQCVGPMDCATGLMGRATTILVRRRPEATRLVISLLPLPDAASLYPLTVTAAVASPSGGSRASAEVRGGAVPHRLSVPIPADLEADAVLDVALRAARVVTAPGLLSARSMTVVEITQE